MERKPSVFGWQADTAGCGHYRIELPLAEYARRGGNATWGEVITPEALETADVIIGQRVCLPGPTGVWQKLCAQGRSLMVYEIDDDLFSVDPSNHVAYPFFTKPEILANVVSNVTASDVVTVTTEPLAEVMRQYNPNVVVVPNRIPAWLLSHNLHREAGRTIGWAGSATHAMDWEDAAPQVGRYLWRDSTARMHIIGGGLFQSMRNWPLDQVTITKWVDSLDDYYRALDFDVALAPLRPHLFNRSKSALRPLEMAALGIPVIASSVGPYEQFVQHGRTGYLVSQSHEWMKYLRALDQDAGLRNEMATSARELASKHTVESNLPSWLNAWQIPAQTKVEAAA
jgi:glycosyltransferase involved in cell wall biosynthesis